MSMCAEDGCKHPKDNGHKFCDAHGGEQREHDEASLPHADRARMEALRRIEARKRDLAAEEAALASLGAKEGN